VTDQTHAQPLGSAEPSEPATATDDALRQLGEYLEGARWFGGKGRGVQVAGVRRLGIIADERPRVVVDLVEVVYDNAETDLYQLPLALYTDSEHRLDHAFVGWWEDPDAGWVHAYDAVHDREAMAAYLRAFAFPPDGPLAFRTRPGVQLDPEAPSTPLSAEQSNSSVMFGEDALLKAFRRITPGINPDIEIHEALTRAGNTHVAQLYGYVATDDLHLAMLQQFLRTASDGWDLALVSARNLFSEGDLHADEVGGDFAAEAYRLGAAVAEVHELLADEFPTEPLDLAATAGVMRDRMTAALDVVPELAEHRAALIERFDAITAIESGSHRAQRIHGDLHLGQTLRTSLGWKLVDFEGEPAKDLDERRLPDSPWRDVAGMLRSFDYAARAVARDLSPTDDDEAAQIAYRAEEWVSRNATAFLDGYVSHRGEPLTGDERALVTAYVADKAVYEAVYETRNRPAWLDIPLAALHRLAEGTTEYATSTSGTESR
jgi:maltokinase